MKLYRVTVPGRSWTMPAPNIQAASQFVKHCPSVRVRAVRGYSIDIEAQTDEQRAARMSPRVTLNMWAPTHVALVAQWPQVCPARRVNKGDPGCYVAGSSTDLALEYAARSKVDWAAKLSAEYFAPERYRK